MGDPANSDEIPGENERESYTGDSWAIEGRRQQLRPICMCGCLVGKWTSWTSRNPARRFQGCTNYKNPRKYCRYFHWIDDPLPDYYKYVLLGLKEQANLVREYERRMGFRAMKLMEVQRQLEAMKLKEADLENEVEMQKLMKDQLEIENARLKEKYGRLKSKAEQMQMVIIKANGKEQVYLGVIVFLVVAFAIAMFVGRFPVVERKMLPFK